ncbi:S41 family peptidase [Desertivirga brevis]|uniref:S41 family peptidase n=1 Tax=Desertivirga brevis TaxID=2810310 RepID=UPI001A975A6F|nr:S41 family peptidase [Pedobacter sp. SYSU D00873]
MFKGITRSFLSIEKRYFFVVCGALSLILGCKKDTKTSVPDNASRTELTKDSIFLYAKQTYLWYNQLPEYNTFNPRTYNRSSEEIENLDDELYALTRYAKNSSNVPYEQGSNEGSPKYSYIDNITDQNPVAYVPGKKANVDLQGNGYDFGLKLDLYGNTSNYRLYIEAVYPGSDAASKGLGRGDYITSIENKDIGTKYNDEIELINDVFFRDKYSAIAVKVTKRNGSNVTLNLTRKSYRSSPIYKDSVYTSGARKVGYMAYARFTNLSNSQSEFNRIFTRFTNSGVTDLIIDLRYNGGGYVSTAEYLMNLIAPASLNREMMYAEHFNKLMQDGKATILKNQLILDASNRPQDSNNDGKLDTYADASYTVASNTRYFSKVGSLNTINNVVFITSSSTASASELVINCLKPHMNVKVVGQTSYGKPVGFFPIRIDKYDVYLSMFESKNSKGEGGYYSGISPDYPIQRAAPRNDFGDLNEDAIKAAYNYITTGAFTGSGNTTSSILSKGILPLEVQGGKQLKDSEFKGMIEDRVRLK